MTRTPHRDLRFEQLPGRASADPLLGTETASSLRIVQLVSGSSRHAHRHPHSEEIVYVRAGRGTAFVDGARYRMEPGDVLHIPAGSPHGTIPDPGERMELICFFPHPDLSDNLEETSIELTTEEA